MENNMNIELKEKIKKYIETTEKEFYPDEISELLNTDFKEVINICEEYMKSKLSKSQTIK